MLRRLIDGLTPLRKAAHKGHAEVVRLLVDARADISKSMSLRITALKGHSEVVHLLIEAGMDINKARTKDGVSPPHSAVQKGHVEIVHLLREAGMQESKTERPKNHQAKSAQIKMSTAISVA